MSELSQELSQSEMDVLVVGAGPTGLTMAAELAARGVGCRIVDKTPVRSGRSRALVVHARSVELLTLEEDAEGVSARLRHENGHEENVRARYVVGADGAHSAVRHTLGLSFEGDAYPQDFVLADTKIDWEGEPDRLYFFLSRRGLLALFPLAGSYSYRLIAPRPGGLPHGSDDPTLEEFQQLATELSPVPMKLYNPSWLARF